MPQLHSIPQFLIKVTLRLIPVQETNKEKRKDELEFLPRK